MQRVYCDVCESVLNRTGVPPVDHQVVFNTLNDGPVYAIATIRLAVAEGTPDICDECIMLSLQGVGREIETPLAQCSNCGAPRMGRVESGSASDIERAHAGFSCCDSDNCKDFLKQKASDMTGESAFFYRDTIGGG